MSQESEFPLLIGGFGTDKSKENEIVRKKSLKDTTHRQGSFDETKDDLYDNTQGADSLDEDEQEVDSNFKNNSFMLVEDSLGSVPGAMNSEIPPGRGYNLNQLHSLLLEQENYETMLFIAINDKRSDAPEAKQTFFEKIGFSNKKKEKMLIETALEAWKIIDDEHADYQNKNNDLKKKLDSLQIELKKKKNEYNHLKSTISFNLSNLSNEKVDSMIKIKSLETAINDSTTMKNSKLSEYREYYKSFTKKTEEIKQIEERWTMTINDIRVTLLDAINKRIVSEKKMNINVELLENLKKLESLKVFQKNQIDFCLEMLSKAIEFFGSSEEHEKFNVRKI